MNPNNGGVNGEAPTPPPAGAGNPNITPGTGPVDSKPLSDLEAAVVKAAQNAAAIQQNPTPTPKTQFKTQFDPDQPQVTEILSPTGSTTESPVGSSADAASTGDVSTTEATAQPEVPQDPKQEFIDTVTAAVKELNETEENKTTSS